MYRFSWQDIYKKLYHRLNDLVHWHESLDDCSRHLQVLMMMALLVLSLGLAGCHYSLNQSIDRYQDANLQLANNISQQHKMQQDLAKLDQEHKDAEARIIQMRAIQQQSLLNWKILADLSARVPAAVRLTRLQQHEQTLKLEGVARTNNDVMRFLEDLADSPLFSTPVLTSLKQSTTQTGLAEDFEISVKCPVVIG